MDDIIGWEYSDEDAMPTSQNLLKILQQNIDYSEKQVAKAQFDKTNMIKFRNSQTKQKCARLKQSKTERAKSSLSNYNSGKERNKVSSEISRYVSHDQKKLKLQKLVNNFSQEDGIKKVPSYLSNIHNVKPKQEEVKYQSIPLVNEKQKNEELQMKKQSLIFGNQNSMKMLVHNFHEMEVKARKKRIKNYNMFSTKDCRGKNNQNVEIVIQFTKYNHKKSTNLQQSIELNNIKKGSVKENVPYTKLSAMKKKMENSGEKKKSIGLRQSNDYFNDIHLSEKNGSVSSFKRKMKSKF